MNRRGQIWHVSTSDGDDVILVLRSRKTVWKTESGTRHDVLYVTSYHGGMGQTFVWEPDHRPWSIDTNFVRIIDAS